jgi:hypothetical protein
MLEPMGRGVLGRPVKPDDDIENRRESYRSLAGTRVILAPSALSRSSMRS